MPDTLSSPDIVSALVQALHSQTHALGVMSRVVGSLESVIHDLTPGDLMFGDVDDDDDCCGDCDKPTLVSEKAPEVITPVDTQTVPAERKRRGRPAGSSKKAEAETVAEPVLEPASEIKAEVSAEASVINPETDPFAEEAPAGKPDVIEEADALLAEFDEPAPAPEPKTWTSGEMFALVTPLVKDPKTKQQVLDAVMKWSKPANSRAISSVPAENYASFLGELRLV